MKSTAYTIPPHRRGDTWDGIGSIRIVVNGVPADLQGASVKMDFREKIDYPVALTLSTENGGIIILDPNIGLIKMPPRIVEIPFGHYIYDLQVTYPDGTVKTYITGSWEIVPDVTE
jgi:hypothetical protein